MKTRSIFYAALFFVICLSSCSKDEEPKGKVSSNQIYVSIVESKSANISFIDPSDEDFHTIIVTDKKSGREIYSGKANGSSYIEDLESNTTYVVRVDVVGYESTPYDTVEFTTKLWDDIHFTDIENGQTTTGSVVTMKTDMSVNADIEGYKFFLVDEEDESDRIELQIEQNGNLLSFTMPEDLIDHGKYYRNFHIEHGRDLSNLEKLVFDGLRNRVRVFLPEAKILYANNARVIPCESIRGHAIALTGFYPSFYTEGYDKSKTNFLLTNLDNNNELLIQGEGSDDINCNYFFMSFSNGTEWYQGMTRGLLNIQFVEDEAQGFVPGNYSAKISYDLPDGFHESNTFEFVIGK